MKIDEKNISKKESISVEFFFNNTKEKFKLRHVNEQISLSRRIFEQNLHRPGLPLAGFLDLFSFSRVQVFGNTEMKYLEDLTFDERVKSLERIFKFAIPCVMITNDNHVPAEMLSLANQYEVPIFVSPYETTKLAYLVSDFLDDQFSPRLSIHGSFVDVYGEGILMGSGTELVKHFMEIRGIGIIDIRSMFGVRAIRYQKRLEVIIELEIWDTESDYTRTGLDTDSINVMDVEMPLIKLPILPGKNITVVSEIIALNYLLKHYGYDAAKVLQERITSKIQQKTNSLNRSVNYFEHDFE